MAQMVEWYAGDRRVASPDIAEKAFDWDVKHQHKETKPESFELTYFNPISEISKLVEYHARNQKWTPPRLKNHKKYRVY